MRVESEARSSSAYPDFECLEMRFLGETRQVFRAGTGPAVIVMHEVPGLYPGVADFGRKVVAQGFSVYMPSLIGRPGKAMSGLYTVQSIARACVMREFTLLAGSKNSPVTAWLRELASFAHSECGGVGVGAVGMCLTGGFALAMAIDDCVVAPVLSQPSLPFGLTKALRQDLGIDEATLAKVKQRAERDDLCVLGLRFSEDRLSPPERFERLHRELGDNFIAVQIDSSRGNAHNIARTAHSVLVHDLVEDPGHPTQQALQEVMAFFRERLHPQPAP